MKKSEAERPRAAGKMVFSLAPPPAGGAGSVGGALCGTSDSDVLTDTSSVQSSDIDRASIRSVDERVEVSIYLISIGLLSDCAGYGCDSGSRIAKITVQRRLQEKIKNSTMHSPF